MIYINKLISYDYLSEELECLNILIPRNKVYWTAVSIKKKKLIKK